MFRKPSHGDIHQEIADNIILTSLEYRTSIEDEQDMQLTADAAAEYAYLKSSIFNLVPALPA